LQVCPLKPVNLLTYVIHLVAIVGSMTSISPFLSNGGGPAAAAPPA